MCSLFAPQNTLESTVDNLLYSLLVRPLLCWYHSGLYTRRLCSTDFTHTAHSVALCLSTILLTFQAGISGPAEAAYSSVSNSYEADQVLSVVMVISPLTE